MFKNKTILKTSLEVNRKMPKNVVNEDKYLFDHEMKKNFSESHVLMKNCFVFGQNILSIRKLSIFEKLFFWKLKKKY